MRKKGIRPCLLDKNQRIVPSQKRVNHEPMRIVKRWGQISGFDSEKYIYQDQTNGPVKKKMTAQTQET